MDNETRKLFKMIENILAPHLSKISYDREFQVVSVEADGKCIVASDTGKYKVRNGIGITLKKGDKCLVHYINGNENNKVIIAKL